MKSQRVLLKNPKNWQRDQKKTAAKALKFKEDKVFPSQSSASLVHLKMNLDRTINLKCTEFVNEDEIRCNEHEIA